MYPPFAVPGVPPEEIWQLFNVSNYHYYKQKVADLVAGLCPFCTIDPAVNTIELENDSWRFWMNKMAPRSGQAGQFIFPLKRHVQKFSDLTPKEMADLLLIIQQAEKLHNLSDGVYVARSGDPSKNAKSVPHFHMNGQFPTGNDRVEVTVAKSSADLEAKLPVLQAFEAMRLWEAQGNTNPLDALTPEQQDLVREKMAPKK